jgi:hypothetical protein
MDRLARIELTESGIVGFTTVCLNFFEYHLEFLNNK